MYSSRAVYCVSDDKYIDYAIVALESVALFHDIDKIVISGELTRDNINKLMERSIDYIKVDIPKKFKSGHWPNVCFLKLAGPELLYQKGYDYSMYIDPDILCVDDLELDKVFEKTVGYSGIVNQAPLSSNFKYPDYIQKKYQLSDEQMNAGNTNGGVMFWNNKYMTDIKLWDKCIEAWEEGHFKAADQSLFALAGIDMPFNHLDHGYNFRVGNDNDMKLEYVHKRIIHFTGSQKPWDSEPEFYKVWRMFAEFLK